MSPSAWFVESLTCWSVLSFVIFVIAWVTKSLILSNAACLSSAVASLSWLICARNSFAFWLIFSRAAGLTRVSGWIIFIAVIPSVAAWFTCSFVWACSIATRAFSFSLANACVATSFSLSVESILLSICCCFSLTAFSISAIAFGLITTSASTLSIAFIAWFVVASTWSFVWFWLIWLNAWSLSWLIWLTAACFSSSVALGVCLTASIRFATSAVILSRAACFFTTSTWTASILFSAVIAAWSTSLLVFAWLRLSIACCLSWFNVLIAAFFSSSVASGVALISANLAL